MNRRPFSLRDVNDMLKPIDPRQLQPRPVVAPTMDPIEAALFNLERIVKKAAANLEAQGVHDVGPEQPRRWVGGGAGHRAWMGVGS